MITPIGKINEHNRNRTILEINEGMPKRKNQETPFNLKLHNKVMNSFNLRTKASFGIVVGNYIYRYMREFVSRHGGNLHPRIYFREFKR